MKVLMIALLVVSATLVSAATAATGESSGVATEAVVGVVLISLSLIRRSRPE